MKVTMVVTIRATIKVTMRVNSSYQDKLQWSSCEWLQQGLL